MAYGLIHKCRSSEIFGIGLSRDCQKFKTEMLMSDDDKLAFFFFFFKSGLKPADFVLLSLFIRDHGRCEPQGCTLDFSGHTGRPKHLLYTPKIPGWYAYPKNI